MKFQNILRYTVICFVFLFLFTVIFHFGLFFLYDQKIYPGVYFAGVSISGLEFTELDAEIIDKLNTYQKDKISFSAPEFSLRVELQDLNFDFDENKILEKAQVFGRSGNLWQDFKNEWQAIFFHYEIPLDNFYNKNVFDELFQIIAEKVNHEAKNASLVIYDGKVLVESAEEKRTVSLVAFEQSFDKNISLLNKEIEVPITLEETEITNEDAHSKVSEAEKILENDLELKWKEQKWTIPAMEYENFLEFNLQKNDGEIELKIVYKDEAYIKNKLSSIAPMIDVSMQEAVIKEISGKKFALKWPQNGQALDITTSLNQILAIFNSEAEKSLNLVVTEITSAYLEEQGIIDVSTLVASGYSEFPIGLGQASRIHNIEVAAAKINDYVVAPNEVFSTNTAIGEISIATGYWGGLALIGGRYAPAVGGGICEIATDLFRAAVHGGYEIVSRQNHSAVIFHYDTPQRGLDATIFPDSGLDFKFRNDTPYYILIQTQVNATNGILTIDFYSTKKTREVSLSTSEIYNVVSPGAPLYIIDSSLAKGQRILSEVPAPGCDVKIVQTIVENGVTRQNNILSHYTPWRAVYLSGE